MNVVNYSELDAILGAVEPLLLSCAGEFKLQRTSIERWRWDEPQITLTWSARDGTDINRSVQVSIDEKTLATSVEITGWRDEDRDEGITRVRSWKHVVTTSHLDPGDIAAKLPSKLKHAFTKVASWTPKDLSQQKLISPTTRRSVGM